jgi:hypothetical protein
MKEGLSSDPFTDKGLFAKRKRRRRKHKPRPNFATWLFIAWIAFMIAAGCKSLYVRWTKGTATHSDDTVSMELVQNASEYKYTDFEP